MADRYDSLAPKDLIITLRSLRRRFDAVGGIVRADPDLLARADEPGVDGASFGQLLDGVAKGLSAIGSGVIELATHTEPTIDVSAVDPPKTGADRLPIEQATASIGDIADKVADVLDEQEADGWSRSAHIVGHQSSDGGSVDLVTLTRSAVRLSIEGLRAAEVAVERLKND